MIGTSSLSVRNFTVVQAQATLFTPELDASATQVDSPLVLKLQEWFPDDPIVLPFPEEAPRDLPRLILIRDNPTNRCEVAPGRLSIHWQPPVGTGGSDLCDFLEDVARVFLGYRGVGGIQVDRLSFVVTRFAPMTAPESFLAGKFLDSRWTEQERDDLQTLEINLHRIVKLHGGFVTNAWSRHSNSLAEISGDRLSGVVIEQDINTVVGETRLDYTDDDIRSFFAEVCSASDEMLTYYYPEGGDHE